MSQYSLAQWSLLTRVPQKQNQGVGRTVFLPEAPEAVLDLYEDCLTPFPASRAHSHALVRGSCLKSLGFRHHLSSNSDLVCD